MNHKQLVQQMADMKAELDIYQSELTKLRSQVTTYENVEEAPAPASTSSRRKLLKRMAIAGIGGIGALGLAATVGSNNTVLAEATPSDNAIEAVGGSGGYGLKASGGTAPLFLVNNAAAGAPTAGAHLRGELYTDSNGTLFYCAGSGTPGTWRKVVSAGSNIGAGGVTFLANPDRYIDTRAGGIVGPGGPAGALAANTTNTYQITGRNGQSGNTALQVPTGATAIIVAVGVVGASAGGFLYGFPGGAPVPTATVLSWPSAGTYKTGATIALSSDGKVSLRSSVATDATLDVIGYYN